MSQSSQSPLRQVVPCLAASGGLLSSGMTVAFPSVASALHIPGQVSWIGSASHLAMILGSLMIGPLLDSYGRKSGLIIALLFAFLGWSLLSGGGWIVGGRLLTGLSAGLSSAPVSVLIAEISAPRLRTTVTTFKHSAFSLGLLIMYSLGLFFKEDRWKGAAVCSAVVSCSCLFGVYLWVPETKRTSSGTLASYRTFFHALPRRADVARPFALMASLAALKQLSGTTVVLSYAVQILRAGGLAEAGTGAVGLGAVRLSASLLAAPLAARYGRRAIASYGGYLSSLALLALASTSSSLFYLLAFVFTSALSSSAIQALVGEVFLPEFRAVSTGLTTTTTYASAFAALHSHPWLLTHLGFRRLLGIYASISVLSTIVTIFFIKDNAHTYRDREEVEVKTEAESTVPLQEVLTDGNSVKT